MLNGEMLKDYRNLKLIIDSNFAKSLDSKSRNETCLPRLTGPAQAGAKPGTRRCLAKPGTIWYPAKQ